MMLTRAEIPEKRYFRIGEVSALTGVEPYVLRYWEAEFPRLKPVRSRSGQRLYRKGDIEIILQVKELLYQKRYTIAGAKKYLQQLREASKEQAGERRPITLEEVKAALLEIRDLLRS